MRKRGRSVAANKGLSTMADDIQPVRRGRPSIYTEEIARELIDRLESGEALVKICDREYLPGLRTVYDWEVSVPGFSARILQARAIGFDRIASDTLDIADDSGGDYVAGEDGQMHFNPESVMRAKLRVETRFKLLSKWDRKRYGDEAASTNVNLTNQVNIVQITEERRRELIAKRREANERLKAQKMARVKDAGNEIE